MQRTARCRFCSRLDVAAAAMPGLPQLHLEIHPRPLWPEAGGVVLSAFRYDWLFRGCEWTFRPFHRGVVTTYALENGAAGEGDNRDHSLFAIRAARCSIHEILAISP
jgi:hypothetical protein